MNRRDLTRYEDVDKIINKRKTEDVFSFFDGLDLLDFGDDIKYK